MGLRSIVPYWYQSGEEIKPGDRITYFGEPGVIEFVADPSTDPEDWYGTELGGGVMIGEPNFFGSVFVSDPRNDSKLIFVGRASVNDEGLPKDA